MHIEMTRSVQVKFSIKRTLCTVLPYIIMLLSLAMASICIYWLYETWNSKAGYSIPVSTTTVSTNHAEIKETLVYPSNSASKRDAVAELAIEHYDLT